MTFRKLVTGACLVLMGTASAFAIEPSHYGKKYGNPEEPATRPYKAFWRGLKAFKYQFKQTIREGQDKAGAVGGKVQFFRAVRRGLVEVGAGTYMGMAGSYPIPVEATHPANQTLDSDRRLAALADLPSTAAIFWAGGAGSVGAVFGPGVVTIAQSEVDRYAMTAEEREEVAAAARRTARQQWAPDPWARNKLRPEGLKHVVTEVVVEAQPGATTEVTVEVEKHKPAGNAYSGNMIEKARRGRISNGK